VREKSNGNEPVTKESLEGLIATVNGLIEAVTELRRQVDLLRAGQTAPVGYPYLVYPAEPFPPQYPWYITGLYESN
jgi:hypothetical protein